MTGTKTPDHLFVYGTLRAGSVHPMAHRLRVGATYIGRGSTVGSLYDFGDHPGALFATEARYRVIGDVFLLRAGRRLLADLDRYEGFADRDDDMFRRVAVEVALDAGGTVQAWAYGLREAPRARLIGTGDFIADRRMRVPKAARP
jgi:gamma-glutamylcyclotransferase (GGCT)/AIG2-like uncharacterized protein YtfP